MSRCQIPRGCILDEESNACPLCDEDGADRIAAHYANKKGDDIMKTVEQIARDMREGTFPQKSEATLRENTALLKRPQGSNADEWQLFLQEYLGDPSPRLNDHEKNQSPRNA